MHLVSWYKLAIDAFNHMYTISKTGGHNTWTHFTVSGKACRIGSACEMNVVTGFYSCELEGAEIGAWDYCCKSDHPCGYSNGFEYPWYVYI